jgi:DNA-binding transcriptional LysR family regulator
MSPALDLELLRTLLLAVERGSFKQAASVVGRTQSAVSLQMRRLEEVVGHPLFRREGRRVLLTEAGEVILEYGRRMLILNEEALLAASGVKLEGKVRLGLLQDFAEAVLPSALASFSRAQPAVQMHVQVETSSRLIEKIKRGTLDLAVIYTFGGSVPGTTSISVARVPMVWALPPHAEMVKPWKLVLLEPPCVFYDAAIALLKKSRQPWIQTFSSPSLAANWAAVEAGLGISLRTPIGFPKMLQSRRTLSGTPKLPHVNITMIQADNSLPTAVSRLCQVVIQSLKDYLA